MRMGRSGVTSTAAIDIFTQHFFVKNDRLHAASAQHKGRAHHERVADAVGDNDRFVNRAAMPDSGIGMPSFFIMLRNKSRSSAAVDGLDAGARIFTPASCKFGGDVERRLSAELADDALGLLLLVNGEHVLDGERLEIELVSRCRSRWRRFPGCS
jgi:hypothetical protein